MEVVEFEVDLVDVLHDRNIEEDVGLVGIADRARVKNVSPLLALGTVPFGAFSAAFWSCGLAEERRPLLRVRVVRRCSMWSLCSPTLSAWASGSCFAVGYLSIRVVFLLGPTQSRQPKTRQGDRNAEFQTV